MKTELQFEHPIDRLSCHSRTNDSYAWPDPTPLLLADSQNQSPYMPLICGRGVEVIDRLSPFPLEDGRFEFPFQLNQEPPELWQIMFENHRNGADVSFSGSLLSIRCRLDELETVYDEIANGALFGATGDYNCERHNLVFEVRRDMTERARRVETEQQILSDLQSYRERRQKLVDWANSNNASISFFLKKLNADFKEILENKFVWWSKVLDSKTIDQYRARFAVEFLQV